MTDEDGIMVELLDYHPYGTERISWSSSSDDGEAESTKTYISEYTDSETSLSYLHARYYDPERGQFLSQDPVYLGVGSGTDKREQILLMDPQSQNGYLYGRGNPLVMKDKTGEMAFLALAPYASSIVAGLTALVSTPALQAQLSDSLSSLRDPSASLAAKVWAGVGVGLSLTPEVKGVSTLKLTPNEIGKIGEKMMGRIVGEGREQVIHNTDLGKRIIDRETMSAIHEAKNGFISASQKILIQIRKDAEIMRDTGKQAVWHLFKGGSENAINSIKNIGGKVIDYTKKYDIKKIK